MFYLAQLPPPTTPSATKRTAWEPTRTRSAFRSDLGESYGEFDEHFKKADTAVFSFWWNADDVMRGVRTVCIVRNPDGGIDVYNFAGGSETEPTHYGSIAEMIEKEEILPICITMVW